MSERITPRSLFRHAAAIAAAIAVTVLSAGFALAGQVNVDDSGLAIQGYDPVAYFTRGKAVPGDADITARHDGATYRFVSQENRAMFEGDPEKYAPAYGGYCAFGMANGYKASIEPDKFTIAGGRLYLNYNGAVQDRWREDIAGFNAKADEEWRRFLTEPAN